MTSVRPLTRRPRLPVNSCKLGRIGRGRVGRGLATARSLTWRSPPASGPALEFDGELLEQRRIAAEVRGLRAGDGANYRAVVVSCTFARDAADERHRPDLTTARSNPAQVREEVRSTPRAEGCAERSRQQFSSSTEPTGCRLRPGSDIDNVRSATVAGLDVIRQAQCRRDHLAVELELHQGVQPQLRTDRTGIERGDRPECGQGNAKSIRVHPCSIDRSSPRLRDFFGGPDRPTPDTSAA